MKIDVFLKISLFAFLCSIVCVIGFVLTGIPLVTMFVAWLWRIAYFSLVAWMCKKIYKKTKRSINIIFIAASFATALYLGVEMALRGDESYETFIYIAFVLFTVICLLSIMVLIGRLIFGTSKSNKNEVKSEESVKEVYATINTDTEIKDTMEWDCICGARNSGNFCLRCGAPKPFEDNANSNIG